MTLLRSALSAAMWILAAKCCELAVRLAPRPIRRVLEVDGATLVPAVPKREEYTRELSEAEAAWVCLSLKVHLARTLGEVRA